MKYYCVEPDECGFYIQTYNVKEYADLVCPNCYGPLLMYEDKDLPFWEEGQRGDASRSDEREF